MFEGAGVEGLTNESKIENNDPVLEEIKAVLYEEEIKHAVKKFLQDAYADSGKAASLDAELNSIGEPFMALATAPEEVVLLLEELMEEKETGAKKELRKKLKALLN
jgi:hypothetical protein